MRKVMLSLDRGVLPVQYGVTAGSLVEQFYDHAVSVVTSAVPSAPPEAAGIEVETEFEGIFFTHHEVTPQTVNTDRDTAWVAGQQNVDWVEVRQVTSDDDYEQRAVILRMRSTINTNDVYFVAATSEEFMTSLILSQTPG